MEAPPARIGPYTLAEPLGEGAAGVVYRAVDGEGHEVALKVLRSELTGREAFAGRLAHEVRAAREIRHRNVVPLLDAGAADDFTYLAFGYFPGSESLAARLARTGPLPLGELVRFALQIAAGLDAMHEAGVVHRDVKPANVILAGDLALVADLGLAKGNDYTALTRPGQVLGSADYLAPELIRGVPATAASDIYGLGCTLYECATGSPPFGGRSMLAVGMAHLSEQPPDPAAARPELPASLSSALLSALAKEPAGRPPTALAYAGLLQVGAGS